MLVFVDESGDLGAKQDRGSSKYFTIALVLFETDEAARACQTSLESFRRTLGLSARHEFKFHDDSHARRLAFLNIVSRHDFYCYTFTLNKVSPKLTGAGFQYRSPGYKWVCRTALENAARDLRSATVVIDGSGERRFRQEMATYLRKQINDAGRRQIGKVKMNRSESDPLLQLADYVAGVTNRWWLDKTGGREYEAYLRNKFRSRRKWP